MIHAENHYCNTSNIFILSDWLTASGKDLDFEKLEVVELASMLRNFYGSVRKR